MPCIGRSLTEGRNGLRAIVNSPRTHPKTRVLALGAAHHGRVAEKVPKPVSVTTERLPKARIALEIEVDQERVDKHMNRAVQRISKQVRIPGFRPGKAPRQTIERHVGSAAILQEALEELVPEVYNEVLADQQIEAIDQPEFELKSTEPLVVKATVPVKPDVDLGDYQALRAPKPAVEISDDQVRETILNLRRQFAVLEPVERGVAWDDHVRADVTVTVEGQPEHREEDAEFPVREGSVVSLPGFVEQLVGLEPGEHEFDVTLPEDFASAELAGKSAHYALTIHEVKREILPDLDEEFVKSLDEEGIETVAQLEERVRSDLQAQAERNANDDYHNEIIDLLVATATLDYADVLVDREIDRLIDRESNHASHTREGLENWLKAVGTTEDELREALREQADLNVRRALVLSELVEAEKIQITDTEIDDEIDDLVTQMAGSAAESQQAVRNLFDTGEGRISIKNQLVTRGAVERLEAICSQPEDSAEDAPRRASRRRRTRVEGEEEPAAEGAGGIDDSEEAAEVSEE